MDAIAKKFRGSRIVVTGSSGFIGSHLVRVLSAIDCELVLLSRRPRPKGEVSVEGQAQIAEYVCDIQDKAVWGDLICDNDIIFHLAGQTLYMGNECPDLDISINFNPLQRMLEVIGTRNLNVRVIMAGTVTQRGFPEQLPLEESQPDVPTTFYDLNKTIAETYLKYYTQFSNVKGTSLRLSNVYGPDFRPQRAKRGVLNIAMKRALCGEPLCVYGHGNHLRDFVYIDDVVRAFLLAADQIDSVNGKHFLVGSGVGTTIADGMHLVANRSKELLGIEVPVCYQEPPQPLLPIDSRNYIVSYKRIQQAIGWKPEVMLLQGVERSLSSLLDHQRSEANLKSGAEFAAQS